MENEMNNHRNFRILRQHLTAINKQELDENRVNIIF